MSALLLAMVIVLTCRSSCWSLIRSGVPSEILCGGLLPRCPRWRTTAIWLSGPRSGPYFVNSLVMAVGAMAVRILVATLAGYSLVVWSLPLGVSRLLFLVQMFPLLLALIPLFILFRELNLVTRLR